MDTIGSVVRGGLQGVHLQAKIGGWKGSRQASTQKNIHKEGTDGRERAV